ncbi:hypothetical protein V5O48_016773 [Marasmius crinis-equi]|uniref:Uncharacterized protein n=1 Tax=Marasmius crinis-equi TaxID=585013 RepID=A0ABR3ER26_9AGAR
MFEHTLWLEERSGLPHRNFPRSAYLPKSLLNTIISKFSTLKSYKNLGAILLSERWRFRESQGQKLFKVLSTFKKTVSRSRRRKPKAKESSDSEDLMDIDDQDELVEAAQGSSQTPTARKRAAGEAELDDDVDKEGAMSQSGTSEGLVVQTRPMRSCRAKRAPAVSAAETAAAYKPAYRTDARSRR